MANVAEVAENIYMIDDQLYSIPKYGSIQITLDTYSHVAPGLQQAAANKFDDIVLHKDNNSDKHIHLTIEK